MSLLFVMMRSANRMAHSSDYRFPDGVEWLFFALFVGFVFLYEFYEGYAWAADNTASVETCQQQFNTENAFRWYRYFSQAGCLVKAKNTPPPAQEAQYESIIEEAANAERE